MNSALTSRRALWAGCGGGASILGVVAAAGLLRLVPDMSLWGSAVLHAIAVFLAWASVRADGRMTAPERELVVLAALFLPGFGPSLAWTLPHRRCDARNSHAAFEDEAATGADDDYQRSTLTGDSARDLARELNMLSPEQVLRGDSMEQKRNMLRSLARIGEARHLAILRRCLHEGEPEIRLCAYNELDKLSRRHEEHIAELRVRVRSGHDLDLLAELAQAYHAYAVSGILEQEMVQYWLQQAAKAAAQVLDEEPSHRGAAVTNALALAAMQRFPDALDALEGFPADAATDADVLLARAEIAVSSRDFDAARAQAARLQELGEPLPPWLAALCPPAEEVVP